MQIPLLYKGAGSPECRYYVFYRFWHSWVEAPPFLQGFCHPSGRYICLYNDSGILAGAVFLSWIWHSRVRLRLFHKDSAPLGCWLRVFCEDSEISNADHCFQKDSGILDCRYRCVCNRTDSLPMRKKAARSPAPAPDSEWRRVRGLLPESLPSGRPPVKV